MYITNCLNVSLLYKYILSVLLGWIRMNRKEESYCKHIIPMSWQDLDASVTCLFDLYMARLDPFERYFFS
jgi:hypothetical protein